MAAISLAIDYDTTKLRALCTGSGAAVSCVTNLNPAIASGFLSNVTLFPNLVPNPPYNATTRRQFRAAWFNLSPVSFSGTMFNLRFVVLAGGSADIKWDLSTPGNCEYADEFADVISNTEWNNGTYSLASGCCVAPAASITPAGPISFCQGGSVTLNANTGSGLSYQWNNNGSPITGATNASYVASASGSYTVVVSSSPNCSSASSPLEVLVKNHSSASITQSICQGQSFTFGSQVLTSAGTYTRTIPSANGCDSVITLNLMVLPVATNSISASICDGQSFVCGTQSFSTAGTYTIILQAANRCDSIITLTLDILPNSTASITQSICEGQSFTFGSQVLTSAGTYTRTIPSANGCDSVITLSLTLRSNSTGFITQSICEGQSFTFGSQVLTSAGTYTRTIPSANGCDSVITLTLTVKPNSSALISAELCQGQTYSFGSQSLTSAGTYTRTIPAANGCDSVITLTLNIIQTVLVTNQPSNRTINLYDSTTFDAQALNALSYAWQISLDNGITYTNILNDNFHSGANTSILLVRALTLSRNGSLYRCIISNSCGSVTTNPRTLNIITPPSIVLYMDDASSCLNNPNSTISIPVRCINFNQVAALNGRIFMPAGAQFIGLNQINPLLTGFAHAFLTSNTLSFSWYRTMGRTLADSSILFTINLTYSGNQNSILSWVNNTLFAFNEFNSPLPINGLYGNLISREPPQVNAGNDITICNGSTLILSATGNASSYLWSTGQTGQSITINPSATAIFSVTGFNEFGCTSIDTVQVSVNNGTQVQISGPDTLTYCIGSPGIQLNASGATSYAWYPSQGLNSPNTPNPIIQPTISTTYKVIGTDLNGCNSTDSVFVMVNTPLQINLNIPNTICFNSNPVTINASISGGTFSGNGVIGNLFDPAAAGVGSHTITYNLVNAQTGCTSIASTNIEVLSIPNGSASADQTICPGQQILLTASGGTSYLWSNGQTSNSISVQPQTTTSYTVTISNTSGCQITDTVVVMVLPSQQLQILGNTSLCRGSSTSLVVSGAATYQWSPTIGINDPLSANPIFSPINSTLYTVFATTTDGCTIRDSVFITVHELPYADAGPDVIHCGNPTTLAASAPTGSTFLWNNGMTTSSISVNPNNTTVYSVIVSNSNGCTFVDSVIVYVPMAFAGSNSNICQGGNTQLSATLFGVPSGLNNLQYAWSPNQGLSGANSANPVANPLTSTVYTVTITEPRTGCMFSSSVAVQVLATPIVSLGQNLALAPNTTIPISGGVTNSNNYTTFSWSLIGTPAGTLAPGIGPNAAFTSFPSPQLVSQLIVLNATNSNGCSSSDTLILTIDPSLGGSLITGNINYANQSAVTINEGSVTLRGPNGGIKNSIIGPSGTYLISNVLDSIYTLQANISKIEGGITVADAQIINDHVINTLQLSGIFLSAADVTGDNQILSNDAQQTAKKAAGLPISNSFDQGSGPGNWYTKTDTISVSGSGIIRNLSVISYGDVNGSYSPIMRSGSTVTLLENLNQSIIILGENLIEVSVKVEENLELGSFQLSLKLPSNVKLKEVKTKYDNKNLYYFYDYMSQSLKVLWFKNEINSKAFLAHSELFSLVLEKSNAQSISENEISLLNYQEFNDQNAKIIPSVRISIPNIGPIENPMKANLYPNPNAGKFRVQYSQEIKDLDHIIISDLQGKLIKEIQPRLFDIINKHTIEYTIDDLSEGFYHFKTIFLNGQSVTNKLNISK
jgi:hypothetical protein